MAVPHDMAITAVGRDETHGRRYAGCVLEVIADTRPGVSREMIVWDAAAGCQRRLAVARAGGVPVVDAPPHVREQARAWREARVREGLAAQEAEDGAKPGRGKRVRLRDGATGTVVWWGASALRGAAGDIPLLAVVTEAGALVFTPAATARVIDAAAYPTPDTAREHFVAVLADAPRALEALLLYRARRAARACADAPVALTAALPDPAFEVRAMRWVAGFTGDRPPLLDIPDGTLVERADLERALLRGEAKLAVWPAPWPMRGCPRLPTGATTAGVVWGAGKLLVALAPGPLADAARSERSVRGGESWD